MQAPYRRNATRCPDAPRRRAAGDPVESRPRRNCLLTYFLYLLVPLPLPLPDMPPLPLPDVDGLGDGDVGLVEGLVELPLPVAPEPEPARSSRMHFSRSSPVMVAHFAGTSVDEPAAEPPLVPVLPEVPLEPDV